MHNLGASMLSLLFAVSSQPIVVRVVQESQVTPLYSNYAFWTLVLTFGLLVVASLGLRSIWIAAQTLEIESNPVLVIEWFTISSVLKSHDVAFNATVNLALSHDAVTIEATEQVIDAKASVCAAVEIESTVVMRIRNVGRSPAINISLPLSIVSLPKTANPGKLAIAAIPANGEAFIPLQNTTPLPIQVRAPRVATHQPSDLPRAAFPASALIKLRLGHLRHDRRFARFFQMASSRRRNIYVSCPRAADLLPSQSASVM